MRHVPSAAAAALAVLAVLATLLATPAAAQGRGFTAEDLVSLQRASDPQVSPDGRSVVFVLRETDREADRGRTDLWLVGIEGGEPRRLTAHEAGDSSPRWAPGGDSIYFLSSRSGSSQVWRLPMAGGEAQQVTDLPLDVSNFLLAPDGGRLAVTMEIFPDCADLACSADRLAAREKDPASGEVYDDLFVRHWDTWEDGRRSQLFALPLGAGGVAGAPVHLSRGLDADVPSKPFGGARGDRVLTRRPVAGLHRPRRRPRGGMVDRLRPLPGPRRRLGGAREPDRRQPGVGHPAGLLARRQARSPTWRWRAPASRPTASGSSSATGRAARRGSWPRAGIARRGASPSRPTARRSMPPRGASGRCRSSRSTWPTARCARWWGMGTSAPPRSRPMAGASSSVTTR